MVTHMVFTPVFFFGIFWVCPSLPKFVGTLIVMFTSLAAAGPFDSRLLGFIGLFCDDEESELVVPTDGPARERGPTCPFPGLCFGLDAAMADEGDEDDKDDEGVHLSCLHSSLWPARQAARWQAWPQYFRCLHPVQKRSLSFAGAWQFAHKSLVALGAVAVGAGWSFMVHCGTGILVYRCGTGSLQML